MKGLFHHVYDVTESDGRYTPVRFTQNQIQALEKLDPLFGKRAGYATGVSLKFYTDAQCISFSFEAVFGRARETGFDIYENNILYKHYAIGKETCSGTVTYPKVYTGRTLLEIYLPASAAVTLCDLELGNWEPVPADDKLVLFYGDSLTQSTYCPFPSGSFVSTVARMTGVDYINRGIGSLFYQESCLDPKDTVKPWLIFVGLGANDMVHRDENDRIVLVNGKPYDNSPEDVPGLIEKARAYLRKLVHIYPNAKVKVITMFHHFLDKSPADRLTEYTYTEALKALCGELSLETVDGNALIPHLEASHVADRIHFSALGSAHVAIALAPHIQKEL